MTIHGTPESQVDILYRKDYVDIARQLRDPDQKVYGTALVGKSWNLLVEGVRIRRQIIETSDPVPPYILQRYGPGSLADFVQQPVINPRLWLQKDKQSVDGLLINGLGAEVRRIEILAGDSSGSLALIKRRKLMEVAGKEVAPRIVGLWQGILASQRGINWREFYSGSEPQV